MLFPENLKTFIRSKFKPLVLAVALFGFTVWFLASLAPAVSRSGAGGNKMLFAVVSGEGFKDISNNLEKNGLIRSSLAMKLYLLASGGAFHLQPGAYALSPALRATEIARAIQKGERQEVKVVIPEGSSLYEIDGILSKNFVLKPGDIIGWAKAQSFPAGGGEPVESIEGRLFPDTYNFFLNSAPGDVAGKMFANFDVKARPLLEKDKNNLERNLILASILEKEVPDFKDRQIVAGILLKRLSVGMPLQVDATICYIKREAGSNSCYPLNPLDFKLASQYNTYLNKGLPPGPIGNPGIQAIKAVLAPISSSFWFYLSDPATKKTIFSETLDKHAGNRVQYIDR
ncbi:MAG: endolytic transglycosylase MltG [Candidatus Liptonbacteria bacterium]|nr:endolytic transglycosylase MltG [Candidatus Liptonbacteria bacterium]